MSKKSKKSKLYSLCLGCGKPMRRKWVACPSCGRQHLAAAPKSSGPAFLAKSAGRPRCGRCGSAASRSARHCTRCGAVLGLAVVKSADAALHDRMVAEADPMRRQALYYGSHPEIPSPWNGGVA
ncbi:MAG: hypothetical protein ACYCVZ_00685 [Streptosporangiaceae bacterium]